MRVEITRSEAVHSARELLVSAIGDDLLTQDGEHVVIRAEMISEYEVAWLVPFNTKEYLETRDPTHAMIPSAVLVPKDRTIRPHYPPSAIDVPVYLARVASGELPWFGQERPER